MNNYVYPLGSIVTLKDDIHVFILSYAVKDKNKKSYEYVGCNILEGFNPNKLYFFNNNEILYPIFIGYQSNKTKIITDKVSEHYEPPKLIFLPIGSIVSTKDNDKVMITGYTILNLIDNQSYDYLGINYKDNEPVYFNKKEITNLHFVGYQTTESIGLSYLLEEIAPDFHEGKNIKEKINKILEENGGN